MSPSFPEATAQLHHLAEWVDTHAAWFEPVARCPNDDDDPDARTLTFDAVLLDDFLNGLRRLGPALAQLAEEVETPASRGGLRLIRGGKA